MKLSFTAILLFAFSLGAQADLTYKDWTMTEVVEDPLLKAATCQAFTNVATAEFPVELSLTFPKDLAKAPVAFIKLDPSLNATQVVIKTSSRELEPALAVNLLGQSPLQSYWYIPMNMDRLIQKIAAANTLDISVYTAGSETPLKISLAGSSKILQEAKRCVGGELFSKTFFKALNDEDAQSYPVDGEITLERGFEFFQAAYVYFLSAESSKKDLETLRYDNRRILREETAAQGEFDSANGKLTQAQVALDKNDQDRSDNQNLITQSEQALKQLGPQKTQAEQMLAQKKAAYEPLRQEAKQYTTRIDSAENQVASARSRIRNLESEISDSRSQIDSLKSEASNLESNIRSWERDVSSAESDRSRAESEYRRYDVDREAREKLEWGGRYRDRKRDLEQARREQVEAQHNVNRLIVEVQNAQNALSSCQSDPSRNCGNEQAVLANYQLQLDQMRAHERRLDNRVDDYERDVRNMEWSARNEAEREKQALQNKYEEANSRLQNLESKIREGRSRLRSIFDYEIPSREQTIRDAQGEIPRQERALSSARRELASAQQEYADFRTRTEFDRVKAEYVQAQNDLEGIVKNIEKSTEAIASAKRKITRLDRDRPALVQNRDRRKVAADQKLAKLQEVQSRMTEFKAKEAELVRALEISEQQFDQSRGLYKTIISEILN